MDRLEHLLVGAGRFAVKEAAHTPLPIDQDEPRAVNEPFLNGSGRILFGYGEFQVVLRQAINLLLWPVRKNHLEDSA